MSMMPVESQAFVIPNSGKLVRVNGEAIAGSRMLLTGDKIGISSRVFEFRYGENPVVIRLVSF